MDDIALAHLNTNFELGNEIPLIQSGASRKVYEIFLDNERAGIILLSLEEDPQATLVWEIIILIFERFQGRGISKKAIKEVLTLNKGERFLALIHEENEAKGGLTKVFKELGFKYYDSADDYTALILK